MEEELPDELEEMNEFEEVIHSMQFVAEYDGELVLNTVLDNYKKIIEESPKDKKKLHKFLNFNEELRELTQQQRKIIDSCKEHKQIKNRDVERIMDINAQKEDIMKKVFKTFGLKFVR
jgi:dsDNA-specific endonuclease/ATPase MutS2